MRWNHISLLPFRVKKTCCNIPSFLILAFCVFFFNFLDQLITRLSFFLITALGFIHSLLFVSLKTFLDFYPGFDYFLPSTYFGMNVLFFSESLKWRFT